MGPVAQVVGVDGHQALFLGLAQEAESGHVKILREDRDDIDLHVINSTQAWFGPGSDADWYAYGCYTS